MKTTTGIGHDDVASRMFLAAACRKDAFPGAVPATHPYPCMGGAIITGPFATWADTIDTRPSHTCVGVLSTDGVALVKHHGKADAHTGGWMS